MVMTPREAADAWAQEFRARQDQTIQDDIARRPRSKPAGVRASSIGDECERALSLDIIAWDQAGSPSPTLQSIFNEGNLHEDDVVCRLRKLKMPLLREQGAAKPYEGITGTPEGEVEWQDGEQKIVLLAEIKSVGPQWERLKSERDLREGAGYIKKWFAQVQVYMLLTGREACVMLLKSKQTGEIRPVVVGLDLDYAQQMLDRAGRVTRAAEAGVPLPHPADLSPCARCRHFGRTCNPPAGVTSGAQILTDEDALDDVAEWRQTLKAAKAHKEAEERIKSRAGSAGMTVIGPMLVTRKPYATTKYDIPDDVKAPYAQKNIAFRTTIQVLGQKDDTEGA